MNDKQDTNDFNNANVMNLNSPASQAVSTGDKPGSSKPDPKVLAEMFKTSIQEEKGRSKPQNRNLIYLMVLMIVFVGFVLLWQLSMQRQIDIIKAELSVTPIISETDLPGAPTPVQSISVLDPEEFTEVDGEFEISAEIEGVNFITMKLFDDNGVEIGSVNSNTSDSVLEKVITKQTLGINKSPSVSSGYLLVYPSDKTLNSPQTVTISLNFKKNVVVDRLNLIGPLGNQLLDSANIRFIGEMKGFPSNTINFIVRDEQGEELSRGEFTAETQEQSSSFIKFDKTVIIGTMPADVSETGKIDFVDPSVEGEIPLLSVPVRFR